MTMLKSKEDKKLNRAALKAITGGITPIRCKNDCSFVNGRQVGCPERDCRPVKCSNDHPSVYGYNCI